MVDQPLFVVLAGPNGAGKSTAAATLLDPSLTFVNADEIAKGLPGYPCQPDQLPNPLQADRGSVDCV
jgi:predicted ABC-type ATPase